MNDEDIHRRAFSARVCPHHSGLNESVFFVFLFLSALLYQNHGSATDPPVSINDLYRQGKGKVARFGQILGQSLDRGHIVVQPARCKSALYLVSADLLQHSGS